MLSIYETLEGYWIVTYQRNERSEMVTLSETPHYSQAYGLFCHMIDAWG